MSRIKELVKRQADSATELFVEHLIYLIRSFKNTNLKIQSFEEIGLAFNLKNKKIGGLFLFTESQTYQIFDPKSNNYQPVSKVALADYVFLVKVELCRDFEEFEGQNNFSKKLKIPLKSWDDLLEKLSDFKIMISYNIILVYSDIVKSYPKSFRTQKIEHILNT